jgi:WD40 repeat protein
MQLCYSPNNEVLVSGGYDAAVKVWDCRSRSIDPIQVMRPFRDSVTSVAVTERCAELARSHCCMSVPGLPPLGHACFGDNDPRIAGLHKLLARGTASSASLADAAARFWLAAWTAPCAALTCAWGGCSPTTCTTR